MEPAGGLLLVLLVACSGQGPANPILSPTPSTCPVTEYVSERPPDLNTASFTETWFGNDALWAGLDRAYDGEWYAGPNGVKVLWYRSARGKLGIQGRRLDGSAPPLRADIPDGYGATGAQASGIIFPTEGCWEVIGSAGEKELRFVVQVRPAGENPVK